MSTGRRVALLAYGLDRPLSGIARYTLELACAVSRLSQPPSLVMLTAGSAQGLPHAQGVTHRSLPASSRLPGLLTLGSVRIPLLARRCAVDLVHDPTGVAPFLFGAAGARTVVTVHDVFAWSVPGHSTLLDTCVYRYWLPRMLPWVDVVIADSCVSKRDISRYLRVPAQRVTVVYPGVSAACQPVTAVQAAAQVRPYGLAPGYILYLGSIETRKNVGGLLRSYARLRQMGERRPLVVAGIKRGRAAPVEEVVRRLGLGPHVLLSGYVADEHLPALYSAADLFAFPSLYEGFGLPPLEAMACGTPVVCSNAGSLPEVLGDAALMVDPQDVEGLASAMWNVLNDRELAQELRQRGLDRARRFSWEKAAQETMAVYERVL
jgi:glycosyltransferase involved in cell wall biosynthesis